MVLWQSDGSDGKRSGAKRAWFYRWDAKGSERKRPSVRPILAPSLPPSLLPIPSSEDSDNDTVSFTTMCFSTVVSSENNSDRTSTDCTRLLELPLTMGNAVNAGATCAATDSSTDDMLLVTSASEFVDFAREQPDRVYSMLKSATLDQLCDLQSSLCYSVTKVQEEKLDELCVLPVPTQQLLSGELEWESTSNNKLRWEAFRTTATWVVSTVPHVHASSRLKAAVRLVLSSLYQWSHAGALAPMQKGCHTYLRRLGNHLHKSYFLKMQLGATLGGYRPRMASQCPDHQFVPSNCEREKPFHRLRTLSRALMTDGASFTAMSSPHSNTVTPAAATWQSLQRKLDKELIYIHFLRLLASVVNETFQSSVNQVLGHLLSNGRLETTSIKSYLRMMSKMFSTKDHGHRPFPRPQFNLDIVRALATFSNVPDLIKGLDLVQERFGAFIRFKNGMQWTTEEAEENFHLRIIIVVIEFRHPMYSNFGQLTSDPIVQQKLKSYLDEEKIPIQAQFAYPPTVWKKQAEAALNWIYGVPSSTPFRMPCELQFVLRPYRDVRYQMHEAYRIIRAPGGRELKRDFTGFARKSREDRASKQDSRTSFMLACRDGCVAAARRLLPQQSQQQLVDGECECVCVCDSAGNI